MGRFASSVNVMNFLSALLGRHEADGGHRWSLLCALVAALVVCSPVQALDGEALPTLQQYCFQCHGDSTSLGGLSLERISSQASVADSFQQWEKVAAALEAHEMPPAAMPQPTDQERAQVVSWIRSELETYTREHAGDPGRVTVRQLTSAEYAYTIEDLTGLDLDLARKFQGEAVGGEGFANFGSVQFMADAKLELYLEAAKLIADHAVIGAGPLGFYPDPGLTGLELSALNRVQKIYRENGFRSASGEGGRPYGMDRYSRVFYVAWRFKHRKTLEEPGATITEIAEREGVSPRFAEHIWSVVTAPDLTYPTTEIVSLWEGLPTPTQSDQLLEEALAGSLKVQEAMIFWPRWLMGAGELAAGGAGDERALVLTESELQAVKQHKFRFASRPNRGGNSTVMISVIAANPTAGDQPVVIWKGGTVRIAGPNRDRNAPGLPLKGLLSVEVLEQLQFGKGPNGTAIDEDAFAMTVGSSVTFEVPLPEGNRRFGIRLEAELQAAPDSDAVVIATITNAGMRGRPSSALMGDASSAGYQKWVDQVLEFGEHLPQVSHREPNPSDRDPIPAPYNGTYNEPERDEFHLMVKYYRLDDFLVEKMLDDSTRKRLDEAWADLKGSWEYHDVRVRFVAGKFGVDLAGKRTADIDQDWIQSLAPEPRGYIEWLKSDYEQVVDAQQQGQPGHVDDVVEFAGRAWRRPLTGSEETELRAFYRGLRDESGLGHREAIQATLARILVAPAFLYRLEHSTNEAGISPVSDWELASRLSYFLWSSMPDDELRRAAAAGELSDDQNLKRQVKRLLADPKARRLSTEFFGQWLGFYRFDKYRGVDTDRFPEFTDSIKAAMYDEAVSFFEYIVRNDRPIREILTADYAFMNKELAEHYGVEKEVSSTDAAELVDDAQSFQRGGLVRLGAILTATSAPLRTSPVKRGDWVLRRVVGTPVPPPPANVPPIPNDDKAFEGQSIREQLEAHQANPTCANCHARIDPLGFPLEHYDAIGRWRETYSEGLPIEDTATLADDTEIAGIDGLMAYLETNEPQVLKTLSAKMVGYALGRTVLASDQPLIDALREAGGDASFSDLAADIVTSRQFRNRRIEEADLVASAHNRNAPV